jgi:hypothetical protein
VPLQRGGAPSREKNRDYARRRDEHHYQDSTPASRNEPSFWRDGSADLAVGLLAIASGRNGASGARARPGSAR